jgi:hypothetical protein
VNIQATSDLVQYVRDVTMSQPYFILIDRVEDGASSPSEPLSEPPGEADDAVRH